MADNNVQYMSSSEGADFLMPFAKDLCAKREEAKKKRKASGLEAVWAKAREQYQGVDEMNRQVADSAHTLDGPIVTNMAPRGKERRSSVFLNITRPYTNAGTARVSDLYLPTGKMPWQLKSTPISDVAMLTSAMREFPAIAEVVGADEELSMQIAASDQETEVAMEAAQELIRDWLKENRWMGEMRLFIKEMGKVGTGILKGPYPETKKISDNVWEILRQLPPHIAQVLENRMKYAPNSSCVKVENFYPDPACGEDVQNGAYVWEEVPDVSVRKLREYKEDETYFADQIQLCLEEGAKDRDGTPKDPSGKTKPPYSLWLYQGQIDLRTLGGDTEGMEELDADGPYAFGSAVLCNDRVIKVSQDLLKKERFSYDVGVWEVRENSWAGIGIPEQIETPQRGLNASVRAMMDNMGYSVGPQVLMLKGIIQPADGDPTMYPYKFWEATVDGISVTIDDVKKALQFLEFPNYTGDLLPVINFWLKMAEDTTSLPLLLQGQSSTEAVGVSQQLQNNATTNLRLIVKELDDSVVVPHLSRYYEWSQLYGPAEVKGDAVPEALGSSVLITRELQQQALMQVLDRFVQPIYGKSPKKGMDAFLEGHQLDPEKFDLTEEEQKQLQAAQEAPDPAVQVAQIRAEVDKYLGDQKTQVEMAKLQEKAGEAELNAETNRDAAEMNAASNVATEDMRQEGANQRELMKEEGEGEGEEKMEDGEGVGTAAPPALLPGEVPNLEEPPEIDTDEALRTLGFE